VLVLFAAAAYEAAVAIEWISMGSVPGQDAPGQAEVTIAALPLAAASYLLAHYYAFDSYYLPSLRRFSDSGSVSSARVYGVVVAAVLVALAITRRPSVAPVLTPILLLICAGTVVAEGVGH
jgi:hypothetical protein